MFSCSLSLPAPTVAVPVLQVDGVGDAAERMHPVLQRHMAQIRVLRPGLHIHADDLVDAQDFTASGEMEAGLRIVVLLEGSVDVSYGRTRVVLSSAATAPQARRAPSAVRAQALLVSVAQPERFVRRGRRGAYARRVSVGVGGAWLDQLVSSAGMDAGAVDAFRRQHLAMHHWQPSARIVALAEQITRAPDLNPLLQHLYMESRALELVGEALSSLAKEAPGPALGPRALADAGPDVPPLRLLPQEYRRMQALHTFLQRDEAVDLSLDALARRVGTNPNTLQRHFRAVYGMSVFEFLREHRLQRARKALEQDGLAVGQAALLAGYTSAANFATAYRKRFGMPPKLARVRV